MPKLNTSRIRDFLTWARPLLPLKLELEAFLLELGRLICLQKLIKSKDYFGDLAPEKIGVECFPWSGFFAATPPPKPKDWKWLGLWETKKTSLCIWFCTEVAADQNRWRVSCQNSWDGATATAANSVMWNLDNHNNHISWWQCWPTIPNRSPIACDRKSATIWHQQQLGSSPIRSCVTSGQGLATIVPLTQSSKSFVRIHPTVVQLCLLCFIVFLEFKDETKNSKLSLSGHVISHTQVTELSQLKLHRPVNCCEKCQKINCGVAASVFQLVTCLIRPVFSQQARKNKSETPGDASQAYLTDIADVSSINSSSWFIILCIISSSMFR